MIGVEPDAILHKEAETNITKYAPHRAEILAGAPVEGCIAYGPFDVILVNGSVEFLPEICSTNWPKAVVWSPLCAAMAPPMRPIRDKRGFTARQKTK